MANGSDLYNATQASVISNKTAEILRTTVLILMLLIFCFFLFFVLVLLGLFFTTHHIREESRYILFAHMLVNDTLSLVTTLVQFTAAIYQIYLPTLICWTMILFSKISFLVTPNNLAIMALERYIAICHPLRHTEICTRQRTNVAVLVLWVVALIPVAVEFIVMSYLIGKGALSINSACSWTTPETSQAQSTIRMLTDGLSFSLVGIIVFYTYVKVVLVARKMVSDKSSASRAGRTVLLHGFQLLLSMSSFTLTLTETYLSYVPFIRLASLFAFIFLPRIISPFVYGVKEAVFRVLVNRRGRMLNKRQHTEQNKGT
ncbi:hypothetical protein GDO86_004839 [Hymenochirus boettgeri]|uniref:G-protein coupled receptors family 1 profile domain-containing protein n=1 Tax=Hymenochirus boettgeri TaxID=247094 RepID=A0A8T2K7I3_9PIPI|nr:hypothetical protein GDO86_004839 [Hymenochirus boettgeri]